MICERCDQSIQAGELYHRAHRADQGVLDGVAMPSVVGEVIVHDYPCPTRIEIRDGHVIMNGEDIGPESNFSPAYTGGLSTAMAMVDAAVEKLKCCEGGPQWGHAWPCPKCPD